MTLRLPRLLAPSGMLAPSGVLSLWSVGWSHWRAHLAPSFCGAHDRVSSGHGQKCHECDTADYFKGYDERAIGDALGAEINARQTGLHPPGN